MKVSIVYLIEQDNDCTMDSYDIPDDFLQGEAGPDFEIELFSTDSVSEALEAATGDFMLVARKGMKLAVDRIEEACRFVADASLITWTDVPATDHIMRYERGYRALSAIWLNPQIETSSLVNLRTVRELNLAEWFAVNERDEYVRTSPVSIMSVFMSLLGDVAVISKSAVINAGETALQFCRPEHVMQLLTVLEQLREFTDEHIRHALWKRLITPQYLPFIDRSYLLKMVSEWYLMKTGIEADLEHPRNFNERANRQKIYDYSPLRSELADKYSVRKYITDRLGERYLIPLVGVWDSPEDIDFDSLPESFVLKATHASGTNIVVEKKQELNFEEARRTMLQWMDYNYAAYGYELQYAYIRPRIVCEQFVNCGLEYQFWCIEGDPKFVSVIHSPHGENAKATFDMEWNRLDFITSPPELKEIIAKPDNFDEMKEIALKLSSGHSFARIDLIAGDGHLWFGEITFTPASGLVRWTELEGNAGEEIARQFF